MKKVFEAELSIEFYEKINTKLINEYPFASSNGISGMISFIFIKKELYSFQTFVIIPIIYK